MKRKLKIRKPVPRKPSHPIGTKKGKKGYNRKKAKKELQLEALGYWRF
jgi:hypothetical protein